MSLRDEACFKDLAGALHAHAGERPIVEIVNSGNWGDALIHAGQREFLRDLGITVHAVPIRHFRRANTLKRRVTNFIRRNLGARRAIITGNGAFRPFYKRAEEMALAAQSFSRVLVMPSSLSLVPDFDLARTELWRRDHGESVTGAANAPFCHDMAFYLRPRARRATKKEAFLFRADFEKGDFELPEGSVDLSAQGTHLSDPEEFLDIIGDYEVIHTNRLHVGIGGALLGREVHLYPSRTGKLRSIFEASLQPFYENVHYHDDEADVARLGAGGGRVL
ncbi:MAG: polysaccharide pyruvyl transferase family protein [Pseudomonadota bacterium]